MIPTSLRKNANQMTRHHMNWRRKEWIHESRSHRDMRNMGAFSLNLTRQWHDRLHLSIEPPKPPVQGVALVMLDIGVEYEHISNDVARLGLIVDEMAQFAMTEQSPEVADSMVELMCNYQSQVAIAQLASDMKQYNRRFANEPRG